MFCCTDAGGDNWQGGRGDVGALRRPPPSHTLPTSNSYIIQLLSRILFIPDTVNTEGIRPANFFSSLQFTSPSVPLISRRQHNVTIPRSATASRTFIFRGKYTRKRCNTALAFYWTTKIVNALQSCETQHKHL